MFLRLSKSKLQFLSLSVGVVLLFLSFTTFAQENEPINSNYLFENGVSPRILDFAASELLQDGSFSSNVTIEVNDGSNTVNYKMQIKS